MLVIATQKRRKDDLMKGKGGCNYYLFVHADGGGRVVIPTIKVWWPNATLFAFIFLYTVDTFIHHSFIHKHSLRPISISSQLSAQWAELPMGAEPRFELGPALQQASALPTEPHCTLTEPHCILLSHTAPC
jgi:hypothetical protein